MAFTRTSGLLLHLTSLPSPYGMGDLGPTAFQFADFLAYARQQLWQVLPLVPVGHGYSPYASPSTFAGNPHLISPHLLHEQGLLTKADLAGVPDFPADRVDFARVIPWKLGLLKQAHAHFQAHATARVRARFEAYCTEQADWLADYALFMALKEAHGGAGWTTWEADLVSRKPAALAAARKRLALEVQQRQFWQYLFSEQWESLKAYCNGKGIRIFGDLPIYVAHDSADVWANPHLFYLDAAGNPTVVAGVPPDYFSETGQRWGNPIYRWEEMQETGYAWWVRRMARALELVDLVRLDHFRGFEAYWEVPASEPTAVNGRWVQGPGAALFETFQEQLGTLPVIAEDLGLITDGVRAIMQQFQFPGMAILQFGFDAGPTNNFLPHNYQKNLAAYTGTHDNDTVAGWYFNNDSTQEAEVAEAARTYCRRYLDIQDEAELHWNFIRTLLSSVANLAVVPMQDLLGLGSEARMNTPGKADGNWGWRYTPDQLTYSLAERLRELTELYGRT
jgi:4-alpha-glucanotransferase